MSARTIPPALPAAPSSPVTAQATPADPWAEAEAFLRLYARETGELSGGALVARLAGARDELRATGQVTLSPAELTHGARVAWRNSTRCVGRAYWPALQLRDLRHVVTGDEVFAQLQEHLRLAWNGGHIAPLISVFGPGVRVHNPQLIRYAAYRQPDGAVLGDPANLALTDTLRALGWAGGPGSAFDVLPLAITAQGQTRLYTLPPECVREVALHHPTCPQLAELGLRWHALPVISDLRLELAGQHFACAPFSGWYLQTEIAARNLADKERYDALPAVARALGLDTSRERTLWRDRALLELNVAVLHSFDAAGVRIADHHSVTRHFVRFEAREARAGRAVHGRWSWLIPPLSPALTPVWGRRYRDRELRPNFFAQPAAPLRPGPLQPGAPEVQPPARCPFH